MFENVADGLVGLFMFFSHWISPAPEMGEVRIFDVLETDSLYKMECGIKIKWNEQMSDIVDAGIPLRISVLNYSDKGDSLSFIRTLICDVSNYKYIYTDSIKKPGSDSIYTSKEYRQVFKAVKNYSRWHSSFQKDANSFHMEVNLLPSHVSQLNRIIDLSEMCGCSKYSRHMYRPKEDAKK